MKPSMNLTPCSINYTASYFEHWSSKIKKEISLSNLTKQMWGNQMISQENKAKKEGRGRGRTKPGKVWMTENELK